MLKHNLRPLPTRLSSDAPAMSARGASENRAPFGMGSNAVQAAGAAVVKPVTTSVGVNALAQRRPGALRDISNSMPVAPNMMDAAKKKAAAVEVVPSHPAEDQDMPDAQQVTDSESTMEVVPQPTALMSAPVAASAPLAAAPAHVIPQAAIFAASSTAYEANGSNGAAADLFRHYLDIEAKSSASPKYMAKQTDINAKMRVILINWLVEVHRKFRLKEETLFLTINVLDRFLEKKAVSRSKLQLVGVGALLIASKYEEIYAPEVSELVEMTDNAYSRDEVLQVECIMLNTLTFELAVPTPFFFSSRFLSASENTEELQHLTMFLLELCLLDYKMLKWLPSVTSAAALYLARRMIGLPVWTAELQRATCYGEPFLRACVSDIQSVLTQPDPKEEAVRKKYASTKFRCVAKIPPCAL